MGEPDEEAAVCGDSDAGATQHFRIAGGLALAVAYISVPPLYIASTDDAYVQADTVSIVPKVAGYVTSLHVTDNSRFKANDLLVEIDPRDFEVAVKVAE